jgi:hypothetical protein
MDVTRSEHALPKDGIYKENKIAIRRPAKRSDRQISIRSGPYMIRAELPDDTFLDT